MYPVPRYNIRGPESRNMAQVGTLCSCGASTLEYLLSFSTNVIIFDKYESVVILLPS